MSLRDKYIAAGKANKLGSVEVPDWGTVHVRALSLGDLDKLKSKEASDVDVNIWTVLLGVGDELGNMLFSEADWEVVKALPWGLVAQLVQAVLKFNKLSADSVDDEKKG